MIVFVGEDVNNGDYAYMSAPDASASIKEIALYYRKHFCEECWVERDEYEEYLIDDLCQEKEYESFTDEQFFAMIAKKMNKIGFTKVIALYVG